MIRTLINTTSTEFILEDLLGKLVQANESFDGLLGGENLLKNSASVAAKLLDGSLILNDGNKNYYGMDAVTFIVNGVQRLTTSDGKPIVTTTDRPKGTTSQLIGCGDDIVNNIIGAGDAFVLQQAPSDTQTTYVDMKYCAPIWIRGGAVRYVDAQLGTHVNLYAVAPAGVPYPCPNGDGTLDLVNGQFVANTNGTGKFKVNATNEVIFDRYFNKKLILGNDIDEILLADPHYLVPPYFMRFELVVPTGNSVDINKVCKVVASQIIYRDKTLTQEIIS
jgi:hypothetical protein